MFLLPKIKKKTAQIFSIPFITYFDNHTEILFKNLLLLLVLNGSHLTRLNQTIVVLFVFSTSSFSSFLIFPSSIVQTHRTRTGRTKTSEGRLCYRTVTVPVDAIHSSIATVKWFSFFLIVSDFSISVNCFFYFNFAPKMFISLS